MSEVGLFAVIPASVRYDKELDTMAILIYGEITALSNVYKESFADNKYFIDTFKLTEENVINSIKKLEQRGHISIKYINESSEQKRVITFLRNI